MQVLKTLTCSGPYSRMYRIKNVLHENDGVNQERERHKNKETQDSHERAKQNVF